MVITKNHYDLFWQSAIDYGSRPTKSFVAFIPTASLINTCKPDMIRHIAHMLSQHWKPLFITSLLYKLLAVIFLAPLVTLPLQLALGLSSDQVLTDQDIAFFFATPLGAISLVIGIAIFISIAASELTALLTILASHQANPSTTAAIQRAYLKKGPIFRVTARATMVLLAITLPFLVIAGLVYRTLLSEFDINFYLQQSPPEFKIAVGIGAVLIVIWLTLILRLVANWFLAVGLATFCDSRPSKEVMQDSRLRVQGFRKKILVWVLIWLRPGLIKSNS